MLINQLGSSLLFFLVFLVFTVARATRPAFTNDTDRQALLALKNVIHHDTNASFRVLDSWNDSVHFCKWRGIRCSTRHQRVAGLDLSSLNLVGVLPPHIGNLTFLRVIKLGENKFHGSIPKEISHLSRLRHLSLMNNSFQGHIPTNLSHCSQLQTILVYLNQLQGKIPLELSYLSKLTKLDLDVNHFVGEILPSFGNLSMLSVLSLRENNLQGYIPADLGRLTNLRYLDLGGNKLSGMIPTPIYNLSSLSLFCVSSNSLHGQLPDDLGLTLPILQGLYFAANQFSGPLPSSLINASGLIILELTDNSFTGPMPYLGNLQQLQKLKASKNRLGVNSGNNLNLFTSLSNCTSLQMLVLAKNQLRVVLPNSVANLSTTLLYLALGHNEIYGSIPQGIGNLVNLKSVQLDDNNLSGEIPDSIGQLFELERLYLNSNNISGKIPSSFGNITRLSILSLWGNMLEGSIPTSFGNCTSLEAIDLSFNNLVGTIPENIVNLPSLTIVMSVGWNKLSGRLPSQMSKMKNVVGLEFSENKFSGEVPSSLGDCQELDSLFMNGNHFQGIIPQSFSKLRGICFLDLSRNNLSGNIPKFLGELPFISYINLSFNSFEGEVPRTGVFTNMSAFSIVGNKNLCGGVKELQLAPCPQNVKKERTHLSHRVTAVIASIPVFIPLLLAGFIAIHLRRRRSKEEKASSASSLGSHIPKISYSQLHRATGEFSPANFIGEGRYGFVYKGVTEDEQVIAVKVLKLHQPGASRSFIAECEALRRIRHRNLIKVITSCSSIDNKGNDFKALVFEFMPNGNLDIWLHSSPSHDDPQQAKHLNFMQRLNIAIDVAAALDYLHHHCDTQIVHCDLKPSNILIDNDLTAHMGDFGLAKLLSANTSNPFGSASSSIGIRGTIGYVAPEYGLGGEPSIKGDIYSYGILLLEMFTGKRPTDEMFSKTKGLHAFVKMSLPHGAVQIIDPKLLLLQDDDTTEATSTRIQPGECYASIFGIGVICSGDLPEERMDMADVLKHLHAIRSAFLKGTQRNINVRM